MLVDLDYLKSHSKIEYDNDDVLLTSYILAAQDYCEKIRGEIFVEDEYGASDAPESFKMAIVLMAGHIADKRSDTDIIDVVNRLSKI